MAEDPKATLQRYLVRTREALLWKLDGLSDYDVRRPMTPTGTNLLGLVKHCAAVSAGYLCDTFGAPFAPTAYLYDDDTEDNADMFASEHESRADIEALWTDAWAACDRSVAALSLDSPGVVPWWPAERANVTLHQVLVHLIDEIARHAGHADIVRELIDNGIGLRPDRRNLPPGDEQWWAAYHARLAEIARHSLLD